MNKKQIYILLGLSAAAILSAFLIVKAFNSSGPEPTKNETKYSQDFIDVESNEIAENESTTESETKESNSLQPISSYDDEELTETSSDNEIVYEEIDYDELMKKVAALGEDATAYDKYLIQAEAMGQYDLSDIGNNTLNNYEDIISEDNESFDSTEIQFFNDLRTLADNYTFTYEEALSYIWASDYTNLEKYINGDYTKAIEDFRALETNGNASFEAIKADYLKGMELSKEGFGIYIEYPGTDKANETFIESDGAFYNGQAKLEQLLESYK